MLSLFPHGVDHYLVGGLLIGSGIALLYIATGRSGGISTSYSAFWTWFVRTPFFRQTALLDTRRWRLVYALGLVLGGALYVALGLPLTPSEMPAWKLALGGLLIGFGARLGGGCTSGHGICGMASRAPGSLVMVGIFLGTAMLTHALLRFAGVSA